MAAACCDFCLATDPLICPRCNNPALDCVLQQTWANLRDTNGDYAATINNSFPPEARNLTPAHVDCLINYTAPVAAALGPEAAAIVADWNTLAHANAYRVLEIAMGMPAQAINIKSNMLRIQAGATAAQAVVIQTVLKEVGEALAAHKAGSSSSTPVSVENEGGGKSSDGTARAIWCGSSSNSLPNMIAYSSRIGSRRTAMFLQGDCVPASP